MATAESISVQKHSDLVVGDAAPSILVLLTLAGVPVAGLAFDTTGMAIAYALKNAAAVDITPATLAAITTAWADGGFKEVNATKFPGIYRLDLPAAACAAAGELMVSVRTTSATDPAYVMIRKSADVAQLVAIKAKTDLTALDSTVAKDATVALDATVAKASALSTAQTAITAIKAVSDVIPNAGALSTLQTAVTAIKAKTDLTALDSTVAKAATFTELDTTVGALTDALIADHIGVALNTDTVRTNH